MNVKISIRAFIIASFFLTSNLHIIVETYGSNLCTGEDKNLECLKENFSVLYRTNYPLFWGILKSAEGKATACISKSEGANFLGLAGIKTTNVEFIEYFNEVMEKLITEKQACFLDALSLLDRRTISDVLIKLKKPLFVDKLTISKIFAENRNAPKYKIIMEIYFENE